MLAQNPKDSEYAEFRKVLESLRKVWPTVHAELIEACDRGYELKEYKVNSALRAAAGQLDASGKTVSMGQVVGYVHTRGKPGAYAWDLPQPPNPNLISLAHYK